MCKCALHENTYKLNSDFWNDKVNERLMMVMMLEPNNINLNYIKVLRKNQRHISKYCIYILSSNVGV